MIFKICVCIVSFGLSFGEVRDKTRIDGAHGSEVVEAVVNRIRESCMFPNDKLFLRRLAYVETHDGDDPVTYRAGYDGGIWQIDHDEFDKTKSSDTSNGLFEDIKSHFAIEWTTVQWSDLRKPLYSGLAAALYLTTLAEQVPRLTSEQEHFYATYFSKSPSSAIKFSKGAQTFDKVCRRTNLDVAFLVDASSSLSPEDFDRAKQFAHDVVNNFQVGENDVRVAFVTFSTGYKSQFDFNKYRDKDALQKAIDGILKSEGQTDTNLALDFASQKLFTPAMGSRDGSSKVILLITDGKSTNGFKTVPAALRARNKGIVIFTIGVGNDVDIQELINVANTPQCTHVIQLGGYSDLSALVSEIQQVSCEAPAVLNPGTYVYPCFQGGLYQIISNGSTTQVKITDSDGMVDVYGSLSNPTPNEAGHAFYSNAIPSTASVILLNGNQKPVYLNISTRAPPYTCKGNYTIKIGTVERVRANTLVTCVDSDVARPCSVAEIYGHLYPAVMPPYSFINQCQRGPASFQPHPLDQTMFLYCGTNGTVFVFQCTPHHVYSQNIADCIPGEASTTLSTSTSPTTRTTTSTSKSTSTSRVSKSTNSISTTTTTITTSTPIPTSTPKFTTITTSAAPITTTATSTSTPTPTPTPTSASSTSTSTSKPTPTPTPTSTPTSTSTSTTTTTTTTTTATTTTITAATRPVIYKTTTSTTSSSPTTARLSPSSASQPTTRTVITTSNRVITPSPYTYNPAANPCTRDNVQKNGGLLLFPFPKDDTKYIDCTNWPNFGYIKSCPVGRVWDQRDLTCIYRTVVIDPTDNTFDKIPNPCSIPVIQSGLVFFPHPLDKQRYIQCDLFGNAFEKVCPEKQIWHQDLLQCIGDGLFVG